MPEETVLIRTLPVERANSACGYTQGDWECREGGYLWYAGDGEGYDPEDTSEICPCCRTKDFLEAAKDEAEACSSYSNCGDSGTGVDIWASAEKVALRANPVAAAQALQELGVVAALESDDSPDGYSVVLCNTQTEAIAV
ncbi:hypothetical protein [Pseudomonas huanghezhanensis]|uniref:hypothetical protein n=1 Tax=Pseudomonas huanghezhanensis TaxID=3002903 RepID=UPI00228588FF|nr:hypothetical protein [Pseudomonas sp. BSw22131]